MAVKGYVPRGDVPFMEWANPLVAHLLAKATDFGLPADRLEELAFALNGFNAAMKAVIDPETRTPVATGKKTEMRERFEKMLRRFVSEFITNSSRVTDWDRRSMGLPVHKTRSTLHPKPDTYPAVIRIERLAPGRYRFYFRDVTADTGRAKPFGVRGMVFGYVIAGSVRVTYADFNRSAFNTRPPFEIQFDPEDFGKTVHFGMCWENTRGEKGPWGPVGSLIIG
jgi:hypothetical protein